jgi:nucleolar protein 56
VTDDTDDTATAGAAWFAGEEDDLAERVREGSASAPDDWPAVAVETGFADDEAGYEAALREATLAAARATVRERERADDQQLIHAIRAADDARRTANELAERVAEWGGSLFELDAEPESSAESESSDEPGITDPDTADAGVAYARSLAERDPDGPAETRVVSLAERVAALADEADRLETYVEDHAPVVAPNLAALAGPTLAARLCSLAGGLDELAKKPSGTLQVLGAEDALFAHLRGDAPSPKHGVIYTHDYVRNTHPAERGSAARALAGKLTIAARVDHYGGDRRPELDEELDDRMATIRARRGGDSE